MLDTSGIRLSIVGHAVVDVTIGPGKSPRKLRWGGIAHALRSAWAIGNHASLRYVAPSCYERQLQNWADAHSSAKHCSIGTVMGAPNVIVVTEPDEAGPQGYEFLLRDELTVELGDSFESLLENPDVQFLVFGDDMPLEKLWTADLNISGCILELSRVPTESFLQVLAQRPVDTLVVSTSDEFFRSYLSPNPSVQAKTLSMWASKLLLKENRGGLRLFDLRSNECLHIPAQTRPILHSIGLGDCLNAAYAVLRAAHDDRTALTYASWIAAEYACTTEPDAFRDAVQALLRIAPEDITAMEGCSLPWEDRPHFPIYIAGPDFNYLDNSVIDRVESALTYHNFRSLRPIALNGQQRGGMTQADLSKMFAADLSLLSEASLMVAVPFVNDPGTFVEIGRFADAGKPVVLFDEHDQVNNLMARRSCDVVCKTLDEVIAAVFHAVSELRGNK